MCQKYGNSLYILPDFYSSTYLIFGSYNTDPPENATKYIKICLTTLYHTKGCLTIDGEEAS